MRNRFMIYRKGHSVASALLFVLLMAHLLLPPLAWLGSAAGFPLGNLFSSEGVRWYYLHIQDCYRSPFMAVVFPVVLVFGAIERSGLSEIIKDTISKGVLSLTYRQRKACLMAGTFLLLYLAGMLLLLLGPHAILLSDRASLSVSFRVRHLANHVFGFCPDLVIICRPEFSFTRLAGMSVCTVLGNPTL